MFLIRVLIGLLVWISAASAEEWTTEEVFTRHKDSVVQIRIIDDKGGAKRSIGSGFMISDDGRLITNFHVVADFVHHPGEHRAEWHSSDGASGPLVLLDVDVVHDLALMQAEALAGLPFLAVESNLPKMGERLFSLGFPYDLGLTIVEGTYNGLLEKSLYERIHLTASINPGMSGGPAIDRNGNVVGVNVATAGDQVSFLVPSRHVIDLLTRDEATTRGELMQRIGAQLRENQARYLSALMQVPFATTALGDYRVPGAIATHINCWSQSDQDQQRLLDHTEVSCQSEDDIFLSGELATGAIRYEHELRSARRVGPLRLWSQLERSFRSFFGNLGGDKASVTEFHCHQDFLENEGLKSKLVLCVRRYREFDGLYDLVQRQVSLNRPDRSLQSTLILTGVDREHGIEFARRFAEEIRWAGQ
jgi:S1-C subfamily serine protease